MNTPKGSPIKYHNSAKLAGVAVTDEAPIFFKKYLAASLPTAADWAGAVILVDDTGELSLRYSDGSTWEIISATAIV